MVGEVRTELALEVLVNNKGSAIVYCNTHIGLNNLDKIGLKRLIRLSHFFSLLSLKRTHRLTVNLAFF